MQCLHTSELISQRKPSHRRSSGGRCSAARRSRPLLDERDVAPRVRAERAGVVVGVPEEAQAVVGDVVPLLARHLARLAADADDVSVKKPTRVRTSPSQRPRPPAGRSSGASPSARAGAVAGSSRRVEQRPARAAADRDGCRTSRPSPPGCARSGRGRTGRGRWRSRRRSARASPSGTGSPTWCTVRPCTTSGAIRSVTRTRASIAVRAVTIVAQPPCSSRAPPPARAHLAEHLRLQLREMGTKRGSCRRRCGAR